MYGDRKHDHQEEHARRDQLLVHGMRQGRGHHEGRPPHCEERETQTKGEESSKEWSPVSGVHHDHRVVDGHACHRAEKSEGVVAVELAFRVHNSGVGTEEEDVVEGKSSQEGVRVVSDNQAHEFLLAELEAGVAVEVRHVEAEPLFRGVVVVGVAVLGEGDILIENTLEHDEPKGEGDVVKGHHQVINGLITGPSVLEVSTVLGGGVDDTLVQTPEDIVVQAESVRSTVPEESSSQVLEAGHGVIGEGSSLVTFLSHETKSNVSLLNHVNIVSTISDCGGDSVSGVGLHKVNNISFLSRRRSVDNCRLAAEQELSDFFVNKLVFLV